METHLTAKEYLREQGYVYKPTERTMSTGEAAILMTDYANHATEEKDKEISELKAEVARLNVELENIWQGNR